MQTGEAAERTGVSLRTIRYCGEVGLKTPSARTRGGFRAHTGTGVARAELVKRSGRSRPTG
ncbi:MerR family DNA-binding transcriptional regulator [Actinomadura sp. NAK00032]|nr:MerR family DNA-binding transcriptional regulator [Actinomadura sp. NAK00032]